MLKETSKSLSELLALKEGSLGDLARQARLREDLSTHMRKHLPASLANGFLHCNVHPDGRLVVLAASPEWASRLRFEAEQIRQICATQGTAVTSVRVKVG